MNLASRVLLLGAVLTGANALAQNKPLPAAMAAASVTVTATVVAVDQAKRIVSLKGENGDVAVLKVGPEVKNLAQVKVGDVVTSEYLRAVALELKKGGDGVRSSVEQPGSAAAKPGQKPAGMVSNTTKIVANVTAVDSKNGTVTVQGPQGNKMDVHVTDPAVLAQVKVGDQIEAVITEAMMVSVSAPLKK